MIESRLPRSMRSIHYNEFLLPLPKIVPVPKPCIVLKPMRINLRFVNTALRSAEAASPLLEISVDPIGGCEGVVAGGKKSACVRAGTESRHEPAEKSHIPEPTE